MLRTPPTNRHCVATLPPSRLRLRSGDENSVSRVRLVNSDGDAVTASDPVAGNNAVVITLDSPGTGLMTDVPVFGGLTVEHCLLDERCQPA